jgi:MFS family permease
VNTIDQSVGAMSSARSAGMKARAAAASMIGTTLEWFDFTAYNTLAALVFGKLFFPSSDPLVGVILAFSTYAVGYVSRPIGGVVLGRLGDKIGRKKVLTVCLALMGVSTMLMGFLPTYNSIGLLSPILLVALRFFQGIAIGGEWAGAVLLSVEHGNEKRRGLNASWTQMGPSSGMLIATGVIALISSQLSQEQFLAWGWRVPFLLSFVLVFAGFWLRHGIDETPMFNEMEKNHSTSNAPVTEVFKSHFRNLMVAGGARVGVGVVYAMSTVFSLSYITTTLQMSKTTGLTGVMIGAGFNALSIPFFAHLSDKFGRRLIYGLGAVSAIIWSASYFYFMDMRTPVTTVLVIVAGLLIHACMYGPQAAFVVEQFPARVRYAGSSLTYTLAGIVSDAFAPLIIVALFSWMHNGHPVSAYVTFAQVVTLTALLFAKKKA